MISYKPLQHTLIEKGVKNGAGQDGRNEQFDPQQTQQESVCRSGGHRANLSGVGLLHHGCGGDKKGQDE
jgi:hypothetical protein